MNQEMEISSDFYDGAVHHEKKCKILHSHSKHSKHHDHDDVDFADFPEFDFYMKAKIKYDEPDTTYYGVRIVTGKVPGAGSSDSHIYLTLLGSKGYSHKIRLQGSLSCFHSKLSTATYDDIIIEVENEHDLGSIETIMIHNESSHAISSWLLDHIEVYHKKTSSKTTFPCLHWIVHKDTITFSSETCLSKDVKDNVILSKQRLVQITDRRNKYMWREYHGLLPSCFNDEQIPIVSDEDFERVKSIDFTKDALKSAAVLGAEFAKRVTEDHFSMNDYEKLSTVLGKPQLSLSELSLWSRDEEFGRQMLNGINPVVIKKCSSLPSNFPVTNEMVEPFLTRGISLEKEMKAGNVYICDMKIMDGLISRPGYVCAAPLCLLYVNSGGKLMPIAIQLNQGDTEDDKVAPNPIFLPSDNLVDWTLAKIYYQSAHSQFHQIYTHYLCCHAAMEAYCIGVMRNLPDAHPVYKLLRPFFRYTLAINTRARATLINDGGIIDSFFSIGGQGRVELMRRGFTAYSVHDTNIKKSISKRMVNELPGYYYRDDGFKVWDALEEYVTKLINRFYPSDLDVADDCEIQAMAMDLHENGFRGGGHDFPEKFTTKDKLIEHCTLIMFTGSAQHASINFRQYNYYGFIPNAPFGLRRSPPTEKGRATFDDLLKTLPDKKSAIESIAVTHLLSQYSDDERFLGQYLENYFIEEDIHGYISDFQKRLKTIEDDIEKRNESLNVPYTSMNPKYIPNSITI